MHAIERTLDQGDDQRQRGLRQGAKGGEGEDLRRVVDLQREALRDEEGKHDVQGGDREPPGHRNAQRGHSREHRHAGYGHRRRGPRDRSERRRDPDQRRNPELPPESGARGCLEGDEARDRRAHGDGAGDRCLQLELDQGRDRDRDRDQETAANRWRRSAAKPPALRDQGDVGTLVAREAAVSAAMGSRGSHRDNSPLAQPGTAGW
jgi:hypothetical protein